MNVQECRDILISTNNHRQRSIQLNKSGIISMIQIRIKILYPTIDVRYLDT